MQSFMQPFMLSCNRAFIHASVKLRGHVKLLMLDQLMTLKGCDIDDVTFIICIFIVDAVPQCGILD